MHVILLERVAKLGQMGDVVSVKQGFAQFCCLHHLNDTDSDTEYSLIYILPHSHKNHEVSPYESQALVFAQ